MRKLLLAAAALMAIGTGAHAQETVRIATEGAYAPWNFVDESGNPAGYEIDLANAICAEAQLTCEILTNDWDSIIPNLLAGNYDVIMAGMSITDERLQTIDFTDNYFPPEPSRYVTSAGNEASIDTSNLSGKRVGVQTSTIQAAYAEENFAGNNTIISFATADQAMADLAAGNIDLILADGSVLEPVVNASGGQIVFVGDEVMIGNGVGAGLRKGEDELKGKLNAALDALKKDGTVDELIVKWFEGRGPYFTE